MPPTVPATLAALGLSLDDGQLQQLERYLDLLLDANATVNLTAVTDRDTAWRKLLLDSLTLAPGLEGVAPGQRVIDVGTGGGIPGIPLAIARPDLQFTLVDATAKKARRVADFARALGLSHVTVEAGRAEDLAHQKAHRERYAVATCRAVGSMREIVEYLLPFCLVPTPAPPAAADDADAATPAGRVVTLKASHAHEELDAAGDAIATLGGGDLAVYDAYPDGSDPQLVVILIEKARPTPRAYPRTPGSARHDPL